MRLPVSVGNQAARASRSSPSARAISSSATAADGLRATARSSACCQVTRRMVAAAADGRAPAAALRARRARAARCPGSSDDDDRDPTRATTSGRRRTLLAPRRAMPRPVRCPRPDAACLPAPPRRDRVRVLVPAQPLDEHEQRRHEEDAQQRRRRHARHDRRPQHAPRRRARAVGPHSGKQPKMNANDVIRIGPQAQARALERGVDQRPAPASAAPWRTRRSGSRSSRSDRPA